MPKKKYMIAKEMYFHNTEKTVLAKVDEKKVKTVLKTPKKSSDK